MDDGWSHFVKNHLRISVYVFKWHVVFKILQHLLDGHFRKVRTFNSIKDFCIIFRHWFIIRIIEKLIIGIKTFVYKHFSGDGIIKGFRI